MTRLVSTVEAARAHGCKVLVYSASGYGKTRMCITAPDPVIISAESGLLSLRKVLLEEGRDLPAVLVSTPKDLIDAYNFCVSSAEMRQFQTIYLDSATEIAEQVLNNAALTAKDPRQAYGEMQVKVLDILKKFRDISKKHVCMTAKMSREKDEVSGRIQWGPMMPGQKLAPQLPYLFDEVFCLRIWQQTPTSEKVRYLQTQPDLQYEAKDRSGFLADMEPPDLSHVFQKMIGGAV